MTEKNPGKVSFREKVGYGLGDAASSMFWKLFGTYLLIFYTDVFGISAAAVGSMFLIVRTWDALVDPVMGMIADRTETRRGKFRPYILWGAIPFGILGVFTFMTPSGLGETGRLVWAYATYSLMMIVYSVVNVPYASLLGVMTPDTKVRTTLSSYRMVFAFIGSIVVFVIIEPLVDFFSNVGHNTSNPQFGWTAAVGVVATIVAILFFCTYSWTKERVRPVNEGHNRTVDDLKDLVRNRPWWILVGAGISMLLFSSIRDGAAAFYFKYYVTGGETASVGILGTSFSLTAIFLILGQMANIAGILLVTPVANRIGKKSAWLGSMAIATVLSVAFYLLDSDDVVMMMGLQILISMCAGAISPLLWSMFADVADHSELKTGRRATGLIFSSSSMSQKFGWSIGGAVAGWLLAWFGYEANAVQSAEVLTGLRLMLSVLPAVGTLLSVLLLLFYPLNEVKVAEVQRRLTQLRNVN
jgi:GPH family glycoside/pentoside/hexuronide:cation symporter